MALIIADRIKETSTTTGTGPLTLAGAMTGMRAFSAVCAVADTVYYAAQGVDTAGYPTPDWEVGLGTYSAANTLTRTTVLSSSNAGAAVVFPAGTRQVWIDIAATQLSGFAQQSALDLKEALANKDATGGYVGLTLFKINFKNAANTLTNFLTNATTVARTWIFPDKDGTVAMTSDITGINSGTNTGDQTITLTGGVTGSGTGSFAATVVTNANLTGVVTSAGNATAIADAALSVAKTSGLQTALDLKAPLASPTFTGTVTVPTPTGATDAVTKAYADAIAQSLDIKNSVRAASTADIAVATALTNLSVIDGVTVATGDRVLLKDQTLGAENGIYVVVASGAASRSGDADTSAEVTGGMYVFVSEGTASADTGFVLTTNDPITLGTTALVFTQFSGAGQITAGSALTKTGNTLDVAVDGASIEVFSDALRVKAAGITSAMLAGLIDATKIADGTVTSAEFQYIGGLTSDAQTQINAKFTLPALTSGSMLFSNGTTIAQDNANLFWDDVNKRWGLGTSSPAVKLDIVGPHVSGTGIARLKGSAGFGFVSIDTTTAGESGFLLKSAGTLVGQFGIVAADNSVYIKNRFSTDTKHFIIAPSGNTSVGPHVATAALHIKAGTAAASTAPLKFTSGPLNTTAEAGAVEFLTDDLYHTITTGAARKALAYNPTQTAPARALNTTYAAPATRSIMVMATVRCATSAGAGTAYAQAKSDGAAPPATIASGIVGIQAGLAGEDNSFQLCFTVAAGANYRIDTTASSGTVTLGSWHETAF